MISGASYTPPSFRLNIPPQKSYYLPDTLIKNINFKRIVQFIPMDKDIVTDVHYLRCDISNFIIVLYNINDSINRISNCVAVKALRKPSLTTNRIIQSSEINILSKQLNIEQKKIFDAWERNAKQIQ